MSLLDLLNQVRQIKGVTSAAVVNEEGFIIEGVASGEMDLGFVGGLIASGLASSQVMANLMSEGQILQTMIEYESGPVLLTPLQEETVKSEGGYAAVITLDSTSNLGRARFQLRKLLPQIAEVVANI